MDEFWRDFPLFPGYEIANTGRVRNKKTGRVLKNRSTPGLVTLRRDGESHYIHCFGVRDRVFDKTEQRPH